MGDFTAFSVVEFLKETLFVGINGMLENNIIIAYSDDLCSKTVTLLNISLENKQDARYASG